MTRQRENGRQRYWKQVRDLADEHHVSVNEARSLWRNIYKEGGIKRLVLNFAAQLRASSSVICPYCRDNLPSDHEDACYQCGSFDHPEPGDYECERPELWTCDGCHTTLHLECFQELGRCTTRGCRRRSGQRGNDPVTHHTRINLRAVPHQDDPEFQRFRSLFEGPSRRFLLIAFAPLLAVIIALIVRALLG